MAAAEETAVGVGTGAGTSGETVFRRDPGAREAAWVDQLLRWVSGLTRFDRVSYGTALEWRPGHANKPNP